MLSRVKRMSKITRRSKPKPASHSNRELPRRRPLLGAPLQLLPPRSFPTPQTRVPNLRSSLLAPPPVPATSAPQSGAPKLPPALHAGWRDAAGLPLDTAPPHAPAPPPFQPFSRCRFIANHPQPLPIHHPEGELGHRMALPRRLAIPVRSQRIIRHHALPLDTMEPFLEL